MTVSDPLIELLAIKLYEHDHQKVWPPARASSSWMALCEEDREFYRQMARGNEELP